MRRTKIVATVGPASNSPETLLDLIHSGVDIFRLNFSHGTHEFHQETIARIRAAGKAAGRDVAILQDLCGPKIRTGMMENGKIELVDGQETVITTRHVLGTPECFQTQYEMLPRDVKARDRILLDDGALEMEVISVDGQDIKAKVIRGGVLKNNKGMNLPNINVSAPSVTEKDIADLKLGVAEGVDFIALSFIRRPEDVAPVREILRQARSSARVIAKIEKPEAIEHIEAIIHAADGVMVARGDLGIEMPIQQVPMIQKMLIRRANEMDRYVITATQMLESMTVNALPTRAEVSDVANAIIDGTDAVMLSGETAAGAHPVGAVRMMSDIAQVTEEYLAKNRPQWNWRMSLSNENPIQDALGHAALNLVEDLKVKAIVVHTQTGGTALFMSKARPFCSILAFTPDAAAARRLRLYWGVEPVLAPDIRTRGELRLAASQVLLEKRLALPGDKFIIVAGTSFGQVGAANAIVMADVGEE